MKKTLLIDDLQKGINMVIYKQFGGGKKKMKYKYKRLKAMLLAGTITVASSNLTGCGNQNSGAVAITQNTTIHFDVGEHIISVPISTENDIRENNVQYEYHPGYEPIGISLNAWGLYHNYFDGGSIIYSNTEEVECSSNSIDKDGNYICTNFGTPIYYNKEGYDSNNNTKEFDIGEHIISVPINEDNRLEQFQYDYHEGYEVVGIATSSWGGYHNYFAGGVLLYKNITPVQCALTDDGYITFGKPIKSEKTKSINENNYY